MNNTAQYRDLLNEAQLPTTTKASSDLQRGFASLLPELLLGVLERRYIDHISPDQIQMQRVYPIERMHICRVSSLGRRIDTPDHTGDMISTLGACQSLNHTLNWTVFSDINEAHLLIGARTRNDSPNAASPQEYCNRVTRAMEASHNGLKFSEGGELNRLSPEFAKFLKNPDLIIGTASGIPSLDNIHAASFLDRLFETAAGSRFSIMTVAETVSREEIETTILLCRHLKDEVSVYVDQTLSSSSSSTKSTSHTDQGESLLSKGVVPVTLGLAAVAMGNGQNELARTILQMGSFISSHEMNRLRAAAKTYSNSSSRSESMTKHLKNSTAAACERAIERYIDRLLEARNAGWWNVSIHILAEDQRTFDKVSEILRILYAGKQGFNEPFRIYEYPGQFQVGGQSIRSGALIPRVQLNDQNTAPQILGTCLSSEELAPLFALPRHALPGLSVTDHPRYSLSYTNTGSAAMLGTITDYTGRSLQEVGLTQRELAKHVLISGMPDAGKSNTGKHLLIETLRVHNVNFLVIEPAKREYRALKGHPNLHDLKVYSLGDKSGEPLRVNPLQVVPGYSLETHIDHIKDVLLASMAAFGGLEQVLTQALRQAYIECGWNIAAASNPYLRNYDSLDERAVLTPTLEDVRYHVKSVVGQIGYSDQIGRDIRSATENRLKSLITGTRGEVLNTRRSTPLKEIFGTPAVIELEGFGNEADMSVMTGFLLVLLREYATVRHTRQPSVLHHVTLIEEAHRLLRSGQRGQREGEANAQGKSVEMFANMLLEMRALGEGLLIADQRPSALTAEVIASTGTKITHRLTAFEDREAISYAMGLEEPAHRRYLNALPTGQALVQIGPSPVSLVKVKHMAYSPTGAFLNSPSNKSDVRTLFRSSGCYKCENPCNYYIHISSGLLEAGTVPSQQTTREPYAFFASLLLADTQTALESYSTWYQMMNIQLLNYLPSVEQDPVLHNGIRFCQMREFSTKWLNKLYSLMVQDGFPLPPARSRLLGDKFGKDLAQPLHSLVSLPIESVHEETFKGIIGVLHKAMVPSDMDVMARLADCSALPRDFVQKNRNELRKDIKPSLNCVPDASLTNLRESVYAFALRQLSTLKAEEHLLAYLSYALRPEQMVQKRIAASLLLTLGDPDQSDEYEVWKQVAVLLTEA